MDMTGVRVNDIWEDLDPRMNGRRLKVLAIVGVYAQVKHPSGSGSVRMVRQDRMRANGTGKRGYRLVEREGVAVLPPAVAAA